MLRGIPIHKNNNKHSSIYKLGTAVFERHCELVVLRSNLPVSARVSRSAPWDLK